MCWIIILLMTLYLKVNKICLFLLVHCVNMGSKDCNKSVRAPLGDTHKLQLNIYDRVCLSSLRCYLFYSLTGHIFFAFVTFSGWFRTRWQSVWYGSINKYSYRHCEPCPSRNVDLHGRTEGSPASGMVSGMDKSRNGN